MIWKKLTGWLQRREQVVGINRRNVQLVYPHNPREHYNLVDDKLDTKRHLAEVDVPLPAVLGVCEGLFAVPRVIESLLDRDHFVLKPANGSGGDGILVVGDRIERGQWKSPSGKVVHAGSLRRHLADIVFGAYSKDRPDTAFVEERVVPHPTYASLWSRGLCDIRVLTLEARPFMAMVRVPTLESEGRANLHQGGLGLAVDIDTGVTTRAWHDGGTITRHPDTDEPLLGLRLPSWDEVLRTAHRAADALPLRYLGVDIVVDHDGRALLLEANARPGLEIQNVNGQGLAEALAAAAGRAA
jgi:alpha-L-glutamate ligase-like protein